MKKRQTERLTEQHIKSKGPKGIFNEIAKKHDLSLKEVSHHIFKYLQEEYPNLKFRYRDNIPKTEINKNLNQVDKRLGVTIFVEKATIKPDGGIIEVNKNGNWKIILISEAKHQGKDIENIEKGILVGKNKNQDLMVAGNAIERSHKNINEMRNMMIDEKHFPYVLFLQGSNFLTESLLVKRPDGREIELRSDIGSLNRIDRLTSANYSMPINMNSCKNIYISVNNKKVMLQSVSIYAKSKPWLPKEMFEVLLDIAKTSLSILNLR